VTKKQLLILLAVFALLAGGLAAWLTFGSDLSTGGLPSGDSTASGGVALTPADRTMGNPKAKLVFIEYGASSCPVCAAWSAESFPTLKASYIDTGKVFYVFRQFPIRPDDGAAEKIARCLPEDKYFAFIDLLWRNQSLWDVENGVVDVHGGLVRLGRMAGLSADQVDKCIDNKTEDDRINKQTADAESRYGITGTPTFILDGTNIGTGNIPISQMSKTIDAALAAKK
jgi:protein-disulfide isomerase